MGVELTECASNRENTQSMGKKRDREGGPETVREESEVQQSKKAKVEESASAPERMSSKRQVIVTVSCRVPSHSEGGGGWVGEAAEGGP